MLHAILHNKAGHWFGATESANQDSESGDDFWQNKIRSLEDSRTSAIFGLLSYLSGQTLNRVLDNALKREESQLDLKWLEPEGFEFVFWPRPNNQTEPDVLVLGRKYGKVTNALIVEAKADDDHTKQDESQGRREVKCVRKIYKPQVMQFLAVGGANREEAIKGVAGTDEVEAGAIGWDALAQAVREQLTAVPRGPEKRVLRDLDVVLEWFGLRPFLGFLKPAELTDRLGPRTATKPPSNLCERAEPSAGRIFAGFLEGDDLEQRIDHAAEEDKGEEMSTEPEKTIRQAHRIVIAHQRRVLDAWRAIDSAISSEADLNFRRWEPLFWRDLPGRPLTPYHTRENVWSWNFQPLFAFRSWWGNKENWFRKDQICLLVDYIADTSIDFSSGKEPDPLEGGQEKDGTTIWIGRWVRFKSDLRPELQNKLWSSILEALAQKEDNEKQTICTLPKSAVDPWAVDLESATIGVFSVELNSELRTPTEFKKNFIDVLLEKSGILKGSDGSRQGAS